MSEPSVSVMALPGAPDELPRLFIDDGGVWRSTAAVGAAGLKAAVLREEADLLLTAVANDTRPFERFRGVVELKMRALWSKLVQEPVRASLKRAADQAKPGEPPPVLRLHLAPGTDWIPWELMHDTEGFLGLRFRVTRLPILPDGQELPEPVRHLETVTSLLANNLVDAGNGEFDTWRKTFEGLLPQGVKEDLVPPDATAGVWPESDGLHVETDILHVTCHGFAHGKQSYWTLNHDSPQEWRYRVSAGELEELAGAGALPLTKRRPLVFGNACSSAAGADSEELDEPADSLAVAFFRGGAVNFVGTFAPVDKPLALQFARVFYEELLQRNRPIATAMWEAKRRFAESPPPGVTGATFLFYCLYGPPDTCFVSGGGGG